jgi:hypothetical protein
MTLILALLKRFEVGGWGPGRSPLTFAKMQFLFYFNA